MWLTDKMKQHDFTVFAIHNDMYEKERQLILKQFRSGSNRVLIATDLDSKSFDDLCTDTITLIVNYDLPMNRENYIHRIGRYIDYGPKLVAINFVCDDDEA
eukprot:245391_1